MTRATVAGAGAPPTVLASAAGSTCPSPTQERRRTAAGLVGLVVLSALVRLEGQGFPLWSDEGISVGIASHSLADIPGVLRQDGSPPLYYALLHQWIDLWGSSAVAVRSLSLVLALVAVPLGFWLARSLFGGRAGWVAAVLVATSPYLTLQSREARMYALVMVLGLLSAASSCQAFAAGRRRWLPAFVLSTALLVYTHTWGSFLALGVAAAWAWRTASAGAEQRRPLLVDGALGFGGVALLVLPWLPTLLAQAGSTGAPWSRRPAAGSMVVALASVLGGVLVALVVAAAVVALARAVRRDPLSPEHVAATFLAVMVVATLVGAWVASQLVPAWSARYFGVFLGPLLLVAALALARAGRPGLVGLAAVALLGVMPVGRAEPKSNVEGLAALLAGLVGPGDVVMSTQMEQVPLLHHELGPALRYSDPTGVVDDPGVADWRHVFERMREARPMAVLDPLVDGLGPGGHVVVVCPLRHGEGEGATGSDEALWYRLMDLHCDTALAGLELRPDLVRELGPVPPLSSPEPGASVSAVVYQRTASPE